MSWKSGNVTMHIWPLEHCLDPIDRWNYGPHVTAVCSAERWSARIAFSMHYDHVYLYDVTPFKIRPKKTVMERLLNEVHHRRFYCRATWWGYMKSVCLNNAQVVKLRSGTVEVAATVNALQGQPGRVVTGSGIYVAGQGVQVEVAWSTGLVTQETLLEV